MMNLRKKLGGGLALLAAFGAAVLTTENAYAALSAKSYVSEGLIAHWDGIENVSYGGAHDSTATKWYDLTGNGTHIALPTGSSWASGGNALSTVRANGTTAGAGGNIANASKVLAAVKAATFTAEIAYNKTEATPASSKGWCNTICTMLILGHADLPVGTYQDDRIGFSPNGARIESTVSKYCTVGTTTGKHSFSCRQNRSEWSVFVDGLSNEGTVAESGITDTATHGLRFNCAWYSDYGLTGDYYSIRIYDRPLATDEIEVNKAVDAVRFFGADASTITLPDGWRFDTSSGVKLEKRLSLSAKGGVGGTVSVNGGSAAAENAVWCEQGGTVTVTLAAAAAEGYVFVGWYGLDDSVKYVNPVSVSIEKDVYAVFHRAEGRVPLSFTWTGVGGWDDQSGWSDEDGMRGIPVAGDSVTIPAGKTATMTNSSPRFASVTVAGTLVTTNWMTCLVADAVTINNGGILTCGAATTNKADMSRVWVVCSNMTIAAGGSIDVDGKGYLGLPKSPGYHVGYGPGAAKCSYNVGSSHGGYGSYKWIHNYRPIQPYDDPAAPAEPGSSGCKNDWGRGGSGGGVVRIEASGEVLVNGTILASGEDSSSSGNTPNHDTAGSGGSVWIDCDTISGAGTIRADGGSGDNPTQSRPGMTAGGGCIAIHYDTGRQTAAAVSGMTISAAAGLWRSSGYSSNCVNADRTRYEADIGTLHFSDAKIVDALLGNGLTGQLRGLSSYQRTGDLDFTVGHVRFAEEGVNVSVSGDLTLGGTASRLEIGGSVATNSSVSILMDLYSGTEPSRLSVGGNLTLGGVSRLDVHAAATNTTDLFGAFVSVGGTMTIGTNCFVYAWSDIETPSAPRFDVGGLYVATGGVFSAARRGARAATSNTESEKRRTAPYVAGPRVAAQGGGRATSGGGHGGRGGTGENTYTYGGYAYDDPYRPWLPGSGGTTYNDWAAGGYGGGAIIVSASNGTIAVYGEINADGERGDVNATGDNKEGNPLGGGGAGGTIFLESRYFVGGSTAVLSAKGGSTTPKTDVIHAGAGGGGRIAVWCGESYDSSVRITSSRVSKSAEPLSGDGDSEFFSFAGTCSVDGGEMLGTYAEQTASSAGGVGTVWFVRVKPRKGITIIVL